MDLIPIENLRSIHIPDSMNTCESWEEIRMSIGIGMEEVDLNPYGDL